MSTEDRSTRLENLMQAVIEHQVKNEAEIERINAAVGGLTANVQDLSAAIDRTNTGLGRAIARLSDAQERTEERLLTLIEHVDGIEGRVKRLERSKS